MFRIGQLHIIYTEGKANLINYLVFKNNHRININLLQLDFITGINDNLIDIPLKKHQTLFMRQNLIKNAPLCRCSHRRLLFMLQTQLMTSKSSTMTLGLVEALLRLCEISSNCNSTKGSVTSDINLQLAKCRTE